MMESVITTLSKLDNYFPQLNEMSTVFSEKNKKNIIHLSSAVSA